MTFLRIDWGRSLLRAKKCTKTQESIPVYLLYSIYTCISYHDSNIFYILSLLMNKRMNEGLTEGRKGREEGRKKGRKEGRKGGRKEGREERRKEQSEKEEAYFN